MMNRFQTLLSNFNLRRYNVREPKLYPTADELGKAVQVEPMKPVLKAPGTRPLRA